MDSRLRGNDINCFFAVIPAKAGMIVRTAYARRPPTVIPAKAGIHTAYPNTNAGKRPPWKENSTSTATGRKMNP